MKIAVIGANGKVGSLVCKKALEKGFDVTGFIKEVKNDEIKNVIKNATDITYDDLKGYDVVVDAVGGWTSETIPNITAAMIHLADVLSNSKTRLIVVGGAGSLYSDNTHTTTVDMDPSFPDAWKPLSLAHGKGLAYLRKSTDLNWLYISPACNFVADGIETGEYKIGNEEVILNSLGNSEISYADYAIALVDEIINQKYNRQRITFVGK